MKPKMTWRQRIAWLDYLLFVKRHRQQEVQEIQGQVIADFLRATLVVMEDIETRFPDYKWEILQGLLKDGLAMRPHPFLTEEQLRVDRER